MKLLAAVLSLMIGWIASVIYLLIFVARDFEAVPFLFGLTSPGAVGLFVALLVWSEFDLEKSRKARLWLLSVFGFILAFLQLRLTRMSDVGLPLVSEAYFALWGAIFGFGSAAGFLYLRRRYA